MYRLSTEHMTAISPERRFEGSAESLEATESRSVYKRQ